jgi:beta-lactamase class A
MAVASDRETLLANRLAAAQAHYSGQFSLAARNLKTGEEILVDAHRSYPTASTFKVPVMVEVFRQAEAGLFGLEDRIALGPDDITGGSGVLRDLQSGINPTVHDLLMLMIIVSDNTATNMLIDKVGGKERVNETMAQMGLGSIVIANKIDFEVIADDNRKLAVASPWDLMQIQAGLAAGSIVSPEASAAMLAIEGRQHYLGQAPRYFGYNPYAAQYDVAPPLKVHLKTGSLKGMRADTGLLRLGDGTDIAYTVMYEVCTDPGFGSEYEGDIINGVVGWIMLDHWWPEELGPMPGGISPYLDAALGDTR